MTALLLIATLLAVVIAYVNGLHDASNAVSTSIATRTMRESSALAYAAILNTLGAVIGLSIGAFSLSWALPLLGFGALDPAALTGSALLAPLLIGSALTVILWDVATWATGTPSSTWHAMYGAAAGGALILGQPVEWGRLLGILALALLIGPLAGALCAHLLARGVIRLAAAGRMGTGAMRCVQTLSAGAVATSHGVIDSHLPMALIVIAAHYEGIAMNPGGGPMPWAILLVAFALGLGTLVGGRRIISTLSRRLTNLTTVQGFAAEAGTAALMGTVSIGLGVTLSSSQTLTSSIAGAGLALGPRQIRWGVYGRIATVWIATPLACFAISAILTLLAYRLL